MCTLTWAGGSEGYTVLFNRDEARTRSVAHPPECCFQNGVRYLAPRDPDGGGTWISVNANGVCIALLNHYVRCADYHPGQPSTTATQTRSRGLLVADLAACHSTDAVSRALNNLPLVRYRPFNLAVFTPFTAPAIWQWDGLRLQRLSPARSLITTSSLQPAIVPRLREHWFDRLCCPDGVRQSPNVDDLLAFHRGAARLPAEANVAMERSSARTVSLTTIRVDRQGIRMEYLDGHPAESAGQHPVTARLPSPCPSNAQSHLHPAVEAAPALRFPAGAGA